ncbi:MAG: hypothetical protein IKS21_00810, partial [Oscillospiraceae bacterium]|nr:hypothetical protein [Oscillospiraceae bacterium]
MGLQNKASCRSVSTWKPSSLNVASKRVKKGCHPAALFASVPESLKVVLAASRVSPDEAEDAGGLTPGKDDN